MERIFNLGILMSKDDEIVPSGGTDHVSGLSESGERLYNQDEIRAATENLMQYMRAVARKYGVGGSAFGSPSRGIHDLQIEGAAEEKGIHLRKAGVRFDNTPSKTGTDATGILRMLKHLTDKILVRGSGGDVSLSSYGEVFSIDIVGNPVTIWEALAPREKRMAQEIGEGGLPRLG